MDSFSRAILSSDIFQSQDLACVLIVLYAAVEQFGAPQCLITDNGGVFRAKQLLAICEALEIEKEYIHPRQSRENLVPEYAPRKKRRKKPMPLQLLLLEDPLSTVTQLFGHCLCLASRSYPKFVP